MIIPNAIAFLSSYYYVLYSSFILKKIKSASTLFPVPRFFRPTHIYIPVTYGAKNSRIWRGNDVLVNSYNSFFYTFSSLFLEIFFYFFIFVLFLLFYSLLIHFLFILVPYFWHFFSLIFHFCSIFSVLFFINIYIINCSSLFLYHFLFFVLFLIYYSLLIFILLIVVPYFYIIFYFLFYFWFIILY